MMRTLALISLLVAGALAGTVPQQGTSDNPRQARWFLGRGTVTKMVEEVRLVTQVTPWSCVVVQPSLPPCRHVRQLNIEATPPTPIMATAPPPMSGFLGFRGDHNLVEPALRRYYLDTAQQDGYYGDMIPVPNYPESGALTPSLQAGWVPLMAREAPGPAQPSPAPADSAAAAAAPAAAAAAPAPAAAAPAAAPAPSASAPAAGDKKPEVGWAEWLGLRGATVTSTLIKYDTTKYVDPDTVVTFSVRGCQPSKLPFDLPLCVTPQGHAAAAPAAPAAPGAAPAVEVAQNPHIYNPAASPAPSTAGTSAAPAPPAPEPGTPAAEEATPLPANHAPAPAPAPAAAA